MGDSPNLNLLSVITYTLLPSCIHGLRYHVPPTLLPRYKSRAYQTTWLGLQTGYAKPHARIFAPEALHVPNHRRKLDETTVTSFHKRTP